MESVREILEYLEYELADAQEQHSECKDKQQRLYFHMKINILIRLIDSIENG